MSNIYLKATIEEKNRGSQSFDFLGFKKFVSFAMSVLGSSNLRRYRWVLKRLGAKLCVVFHYFHFESNSDFLKSKTACILLNKNINFNKSKTESRMENPTHSFRETNLSSYKNCKSKVKLWWVGARERKKKLFFVPFILSKECFLTFVFYLNV